MALSTRVHQGCSGCPGCPRSTAKNKIEASSALYSAGFRPLHRNGRISAATASAISLLGQPEATVYDLLSLEYYKHSTACMYHLYQRVSINNVCRMMNSTCNSRGYCCFDFVWFIYQHIAKVCSWLPSWLDCLLLNDNIAGRIFTMYRFITRMLEILTVGHRALFFLEDRMASKEALIPQRKQEPFRESRLICKLTRKHD
jgi:hypothetical protein